MKNTFKKNKWFFSVSGIGKDMMFAMSTIMAIFFTDYIGINPAFIGIMFMIVRVWDAINDPIMGSIVDNTKSRFGKFRPWILIGSILNAIILIFVFYNTNLARDSIEIMIYVTVFYTLWGMTYTIMDIPFWSMIPALTEKKEERESVSSLTRLFTSIGYFIVSAPYIVIVSMLGGGEGNAERIKGFFLFAIIVSVVFLVLQVIMVFNVKEQVDIKVRDRITLKGMFKLLKDNDQLMVVMLVVIITNFVLYITSSMAYYYIKYDVGQGSTALLFPFLATGGVLQLIGISVFPRIAKKYTRKQIYNFGIYIQIVAFILLFINAFILSNVVSLIFVFGAFVFLGQGMQMVLTTVLLADTVEYGELKTGRRSEAVVFSVQTFVVKLATGLAMGVVGVGLAIFGYVADTDNTYIAQSDSTILGIRLIMFVLPVFGMLLSRYIFNKYHKIDKQKYNEIMEELKVKRGE